MREGIGFILIQRALRSPIMARVGHHLQMMDPVARVVFGIVTSTITVTSLNTKILSIVTWVKFMESWTICGPKLPAFGES